MLLSPLLSLVLLASACSGDGDSSNTTAGDSTAPATGEPADSAAGGSGGDGSGGQAATMDGAAGAAATDGAAGAAGDPSADLLDLFGIQMGCDFVGSPFGHAGTATIRGTGTLPDGLDRGYQLNLMIGADGLQSGVLGENLFDIVSVCETPTFGYEITMVDAGQWSLYVEVLDPNQPDDNLATVYEAEGDTTITVADGETVEQDVSFTGP